jgi:hypothetical protein
MDIKADELYWIAENDFGKCVLQSDAEFLTNACEFSLKYLVSKIEFIYLIAKNSLVDVNEPVNGEVLVSG